MKTELLPILSTVPKGADFPTEEPESALEFVQTWESLAQHTNIPELPFDQAGMQNPRVDQAIDRPVPFRKTDVDGDILLINTAPPVAGGIGGPSGNFEIDSHPIATQAKINDVISPKAGRFHPEQISIERSKPIAPKTAAQEPETNSPQSQLPKPNFELSHRDIPHLIQPSNQVLQTPDKNTVVGTQQELTSPVADIADLYRPVTQTTVADEPWRLPTSRMPKPEMPPSTEPVQYFDPDTEIETSAKLPPTLASKPTPEIATTQFKSQLMARTKVPPVSEANTHQFEPDLPSTEPHRTVSDAPKIEKAEVYSTIKPTALQPVSTMQNRLIDTSPKPTGPQIDPVRSVPVIHERSFEQMDRSTGREIHIPRTLSRSPSINHIETPVAIESVAAALDKTADLAPLADIALAEVQSSATTVTRTNLPTLVAPTEFAPQVIKTIAEAVGNLQDRPVELTLNPEELGRVRLTLQNIEGNMSVAVTAERPETLDLLRRHIDMLANQLREIGYKEILFDFSGRENSFAEKGTSRQNDQPDEVSGPVPDQLAEPVRISLAGPGSVDIRL